MLFDYYVISHDDEEGVRGTDAQACGLTIMKITYTLNRGPYILCASDRILHAQFTEPILRRCSMAGCLPVSKLNFITPGLRA